GGARRLDGGARRDRGGRRPRDRGQVPARWPPRVPAGRGGGGLRVCDRDAAAPAELDERALARRTRECARPGRALRDGPGSDAGGGPVPRAAADVQGTAAGDLVGAVLRDGRVARVRARVLDPDDLAASDRLGG